MESTPSPAPSVPRLWSARAIEAALGVRHGTVAYLANIGLLSPAPLPGKRRRYTEEAVRAALLAQPATTPSGRPREVVA